MSLASLLFFFSLLALASGRTTLTSLGVGDASSSNVKLSGGIQKGIYTAPIRIGTPAQSFVVAIDTTSADLLVVQSGCMNNAGQPCASSTGGFVLAQSKTYLSANCTYVPNCACNSTTNQTQPCSLSIPSLQLSGIFGVDTLGFGNSSAQVPIGLVTNAPSLWSSATQDGQIGFAYSATSLTGAKSIFRFLGIYQFAICFGQTGGTLTLGAPDTTLYTGVPQAVPILQRDVANEYTRFIVPLVFFALSGPSVKNDSQPLNTQPYTTVIDSTSPSIQLPAPLYAALRAQLNATCYSSSPSYLLCSARGLLVTDLTLVYDKNLDLERLPDIILTFSDITGNIFSLNVPSTHWVRYWPARSTGYDWEAAMAITASADNTIVLGQTFLSTYYTMFDKEANVTSFAPATDACYYGYSQQPGKVLRVPSLLILLGSLGVVALIFGAAVVIILRTRRSNYTIIYG